MKNGKTLINFRVNESDLIILRERAKANNTSMTGLVLSSIRKTTAPEPKKDSEMTTRILAEIVQMMHEQNAKIQEQNEKINELTEIISKNHSATKNLIIDRVNNLGKWAIRCFNATVCLSEDSSPHIRNKFEKMVDSIKQEDNIK